MIRTLDRILLSGIFISGGWAAFSNPGGRVKKVADVGIQQPDQAVKLNGALMIVFGALLGLDILPKLAATVLIGTMIPTTFVGHAFWKEETDQGRQMQLTQFLKNLGLIGGLLMVLREKKRK